MRGFLPHFILITAALFMAFLLVPGTAFAEDGQQEVELEDMMSDDAETTNVQDRDTEVDVEVEERRAPRDEPNWAAIIGRNALWGGITGGLIGFGIYLVTGLEADPWLIAQFAGGGILVGAGVGVIEFMVRTEAFTYEQPTSLQWIERDMPRTYEMPLLNVEF